MFKFEIKIVDFEKINPKKLKFFKCKYKSDLRKAFADIVNN